MAIDWNHPDISPFDIADYINDAEEAQGYLQACMDDGIERWLQGLGEIAKSKGMAQLSEKTGLGYQSLYKTLSGKVDPKIKTIDKIVRSMGFELKLVERHH